MCVESRVRVQSEQITVSDEYSWLVRDAADGAIVTFVGKVRNQNQGDNISELTLEYYPGMTEKALKKIVTLAGSRWSLGRISIIHRVGKLYPGEIIVFVGVTGVHRKEAFSAAEFIMDLLKKDAPFWKKEETSHGKRWVDARDEDRQAAERWLKLSD